jgi:hypothetical protein
VLELFSLTLHLESITSSSYFECPTASQTHVLGHAKGVYKLHGDLLNFSTGSLNCLYSHMLLKINSDFASKE